MLTMLTLLLLLPRLSDELDRSKASSGILLEKRNLTSPAAKKRKAYCHDKETIKHTKGVTLCENEDDNDFAWKLRGGHSLLFELIAVHVQTSCHHIAWCKSTQKDSLKQGWWLCDDMDTSGHIYHHEYKQALMKINRASPNVAGLLYKIRRVTDVACTGHV